MERRAKKRKASFINQRSPPNKRRTIENSYAIQVQMPIWLLTLISKAPGSYMKAASGSYQYINTCVPDTLLASFHIISIKHLHIRSVLMSVHPFRELINILNEGKYNYARALWIRQLPDFYKRDRFSNIKDHFSILDKLVCAKVDYHQETPQNHSIYGTTLSKFRSLGDLRALGDISDPSLILVHRDVFNPRYDLCMPRIPPLAVTDDNKRTFELEVLLVGDKRYQHMFKCFKLFGSVWMLHDNTRGIPFRYFDFTKLCSNRDVCICSAIYVNTTQADDYKNGVPETSPLVEHNKILSEPMDQDSEQDLETLLQNMLIC